MSITDLTPPGQTGAIAFDIELSHPPEKVWRALTDPALLSQWLLPVAGLPLEPGARFSFQAPPQAGWDGAVSCELLGVEPLRQLRYTWVVGELDTVVTFTLHPTAGGTRLSLQHTGFKEHQRQNFGGARFGWKLFAGRLTQLLSEDNV